LSLQPLEGTDVALSTTTHTLKLYGKTITGGKVAAMIRMAFSARTGVTMKIDVRSEEEGVAALVVGVSVLDTNFGKGDMIITATMKELFLTRRIK
jgi:hypothetical protein